MDKMMLSLKNIYKMLMSDDFPIYSVSVIPEKRRKGQTLLRFWQSMVVEEFRGQSCGSLIWRSDGKRSRYLSNLCNRSADPDFCGEYAREIASALSDTVMLKQIDRFCGFLSEREYRQDILLRRIREMTRLLMEEDNCAPERLLRKIREIASPGGQRECTGIQGDLFRAGYLLSVMMLCAMAGDAMEELAVLLEEKRCSMGALWQSRRETARSRQNPTVFLTAHSGTLQDNPLPRRRFFGREEALYDILEMVTDRRKCLISGIGGIGKTELLRQILRLCEEEQVVDRIAVVPYDTGIMESFSRAFQGGFRLRPEENFRRILIMLEKESAAGRKILIVIDDMNRSVEEDPALEQLQEIPCSVLITSRRPSLEGFETYRLENPSVTTGTLIFRDNYGHPLSREDRKQLDQLLRDETICHPLTLNLMARAARSRNWPVARLEEHLRQEGVSLTWVEEDRILKTDRIYNRLYSIWKVPDSCQRIAELFTLLPPGSYTETFLSSLFPELFGEDPSEKLMTLAEGGWLDALNSGYSMHPLVAECLRRKIITEERLEPLLKGLRQSLPPLQIFWDEMEDGDPETEQSGRILLYMAEYMTGNISRRLMLDLMNAANMQQCTQSTKESYARKLQQWHRRCRERDDLTETVLWGVLGNWTLAETEAAKTLYQRQKNRLTAPKKIFLDFCLSVGSDLSFMGQPELAEQMLKEVLCAEASPAQKATAYYHLAGNCFQLGSAEEAVRWNEQGVAYVQAHPECGTLPRFNNLHMQCNNCLRYRQKEKAYQLIRQLEEMMEGIERVDLRIQLLSVQGLYEMVFGDPRKAMEYTTKQMQMNLEYCGRDINHYYLLGSVAQIHARLKQYDESIARYDEVIAYARESGINRLLQSACNNVSVPCIQSGRPEKALEYLKVAVAEGRKSGGLMLGESLRNTALAWGQLGDTEKELAACKEAWPLLLQAYGPEHERVAPVRQRLEELEPEFLR